jgi:hypothetical protein
MSILQVSNLHFESTGNNRLQYTGSNTYNLVAGGTTVATVNTTAVNFPLSVGLNTVTANTLAVNTVTANTLAVNTTISANGSVGTAGQALFSGGAGGNSYWNTLPSTITLGTTQTPTSGANVDFTSIPSGTKRITINFSGISGGVGTTRFLIQLGDSGGIEVTGYNSYSGRTSTNGVNGIGDTTGFAINISGPPAEISGSVILSLLDVATFVWSALGHVSDPINTVGISVSGSKTLSAALDRVRINAVSGSFDAGSINIMCE